MGGTVSAEARPKLESFVRVQRDGVRDRWVLQGPERVLVLDDTSKEILDHCDGATRVGDIVARLAAVYEEEPSVIEHDIVAVLQLLADKNMLVVDTGGAA